MKTLFIEFYFIYNYKKKSTQVRKNKFKKNEVKKIILELNLQ